MCECLAVVQLTYDLIDCVAVEAQIFLEVSLLLGIAQAVVELLLL